VRFASSNINLSLPWRKGVLSCYCSPNLISDNPNFGWTEDINTNLSIDWPFVLKNPDLPWDSGLFAFDRSIDYVMEDIEAFTSYWNSPDNSHIIARANKLDLIHIMPPNLIRQIDPNEISDVMLFNDILDRYWSYISGKDTNVKPYIDFIKWATNNCSDNCAKYANDILSAYNSSIDVSELSIRQNPDRWNWLELANNPRISIKLITDYLRGELTGQVMSLDEINCCDDITTDDIVNIDNGGLWAFYSRNKNISFSYILSNLDLPWNKLELSRRSDFTLEIAKKLKFYDLSSAILTEVISVSELDEIEDLLDWPKLTREVIYNNPSLLWRYPSRWDIDGIINELGCIIE
jgi:hypothetical protein